MKYILAYVAVALCSIFRVTMASPLSMVPSDDVWINELHYDGLGAFGNDFVEVAYKPGVDINGFKLFLYGSNGLVRNKQDGYPLSLATKDESGIVFFAVLTFNNLLNSTTGLALVNGADTIQFLSYEGTVTATTGPANTMPSTDILVFEVPSTARNHSLQLGGRGCAYSDFKWNTTSIIKTSGKANKFQTLICPCIDGTICGDYGTCQTNSPIGTGYSCMCEDGYAWNGVAGAVCVDINECDVAQPPCGEGTCHNNLGSIFTCSCPSGYDGDGTQDCTDINECAVASPPCGAGTCINHLGISFTCNCPDGYEGTDTQVCTDINECTAVPPPCAGGTCVNHLGSTYTCSCPSGYTGTGSQGCSDINECDEGQCKDSVSCDNTEGSFICTCPTDWVYSPSYGGCVDPNDLQFSLLSWFDTDRVLGFDWRYVPYHDDDRWDDDDYRHYDDYNGGCNKLSPLVLTRHYDDRNRFKILPDGLVVTAVDYCELSIEAYTNQACRNGPDVTLAEPIQGAANETWTFKQAQHPNDNWVEFVNPICDFQALEIVSDPSDPHIIANSLDYYETQRWMILDFSPLFRIMDAATSEFALTVTYNGIDCSAGDTLEINPTFPGDRYQLFKRGIFGDIVLDLCDLNVAVGTDSCSDTPIINTRTWSDYQKFAVTPFGDQVIMNPTCNSALTLEIVPNDSINVYFRAPSVGADNQKWKLVYD